MKRALLILNMLLIASPVSAISQSDLKAVLNDTVFYDPFDNSCLANQDAGLLGSDNIEKAFRFFVQQGLTDVQSAGILGNFMLESGVRPEAQQDRSSDPFPKPNVGFGIAQWTTPGRQQNLVRFAQEAGAPVNTLAPQLGFAWKELTESYGGTLAKLRATNDITEATRIIVEEYERPANNELQKRSRYAQQIYNNYAGTVATGSAPPIISTGSCIGNGQNTQYIEGFTVFSQYDPAWRDRPYSSSTIGVAGCGPAAMAMIITALTGKIITPVETAQYAASQNLYVPGVGSSWSISPVLAQHWGLKSAPIGADIANIAATLRSGGLVITAGEGAKPFTTNGHFIVIRAVTADGKFKVGDSGHRDTSDQEWDPEQLVANMRDGSVYAITK